MKIGGLRTVDNGGVRQQGTGEQQKKKCSSRESISTSTTERKT